MSAPAGALWRAIVSRTKTAIRCNALHPIRTEQSSIEEAGILFTVRWVTSLLRKDLDMRRKPAGNPFLPPEAPLTVADLSQTHVAVLNKYNVFEHHLLIVTREFRHQQTPLDRNDFDALWRCLDDFPSLGFYNGGKIAGASQTHKHLQLVPLPLSEREPIPIDVALRGVDAPGTFRTVPLFDFRHCFYRFEPFGRSRQVAEATHSIYLAMLERLDLSPETVDGETRIVRPYNLLVGPAWMLLVPRSRETFHGISINALGYAGSFFTRRKSQAAILRRYGPLASLKAVGCAR